MPVVKGIIFKRGTSDRLAQVLITNLNSKVLMVSDELGGFTIAVQPGDTLQFTKNDFAEQKIAVTVAAEMVVYMQPVIKLEQVTIKSHNKAQELNEVMNEYRGLGIYNNGKSLPFWQFFNSPVSGIYQLFGKGPAEARRFQKYAANELQADEVNRRYTKELVIKNTGLSDEEAVKFMEVYTPSYQDIKAWNDYQIIMYIKRSYSFYKKHQHVGTLPKLY
jgi:hypothetical protein